jgi:hypothetical protein
VGHNTDYGRECLRHGIGNREYFRDGVGTGGRGIPYGESKEEKNPSNALGELRRPIEHPHPHLSHNHIVTYFQRMEK